ncbi:hypothetical protein DUNSADRAFT_11017 [Dunaliella salina]|uniref:Uncharacterized protein n=1 Tax=Dunaliella salina TaxID=3046 RepID=A0ABQ7GE98_DUNSA|nr:hypothetical protein DUNSADRAFT_11017 [Dunaliella salina]|eukprot:KAF5832937.1 hypothetical protein DUNSADRAFT_11017 [Dunaliella salina]
MDSSSRLSSSSSSLGSALAATVPKCRKHTRPVLLPSGLKSWAAGSLPRNSSRSSGLHERKRDLTGSCIPATASSVNPDKLPPPDGASLADSIEAADLPYHYPGSGGDDVMEHTGLPISTRKAINQLLMSASTIPELQTVLVTHASHMDGVNASHALYRLAKLVNLYSCTMDAAGVPLAEAMPAVWDSAASGSMVRQHVRADVQHQWSCMGACVHDQFGPQELSNMLWAFVKLHHYPGRSVLLRSETLTLRRLMTSRSRFIPATRASNITTAAHANTASQTLPHQAPTSHPQQPPPSQSPRHVPPPLLTPHSRYSGASAPAAEQPHLQHTGNGLETSSSSSSSSSGSSTDLHTGVDQRFGADSGGSNTSGSSNSSSAPSDSSLDPSSPPQEAGSSSSNGRDGPHLHSSAQPNSTFTPPLPARLAVGAAVRVVSICAQCDHIEQFAALRQHDGSVRQAVAQVLNSIVFSCLRVGQSPWMLIDYAESRGIRLIQPGLSLLSLMRALLEPQPPHEPALHFSVLLLLPNRQLPLLLWSLPQHLLHWQARQLQQPSLRVQTCPLRAHMSPYREKRGLTRRPRVQTHYDGSTGDIGSGSSSNHTFAAAAGVGGAVSTGTVPRARTLFGSLDDEQGGKGAERADRQWFARFVADGGELVPRAAEPSNGSSSSSSPMGVTPQQNGGRLWPGVAGEGQDEGLGKRQGAFQADTPLEHGEQRGANNLHQQLQQQQQSESWPINGIHRGPLDCQGSSGIEQPHNASVSLSSPDPAASSPHSSQQPCQAGAPHSPPLPSLHASASLARASSTGNSSSTLSPSKSEAKSRSSSTTVLDVRAELGAENPLPSPSFSSPSLLARPIATSSRDEDAAPSATSSRDEDAASSRDEDSRQ